MSYTAQDIKILEGLDAVRRRPGMYIGSTGYRGLHHLLWEIVDNAIDEAANGFADKIDVTLHTDGSVTVFDNGRGIPVDMHAEKKVSGVEVVFTELHAGGKFGNASYAYSGGLHGVGASVVNALSCWLTAEIGRNGMLYKQEFETVMENGKLCAGKPKYPLKQIGECTWHGSRVTWLPDPDVFDETKYSFDRVARRLKELAFLVRGVRITLTDEREEPAKQVVYHFTGGLSDYVQSVNQNAQRTPINDLPILIEGESAGIKVELAMQYTESSDENIYSFVNNIPTSDGGMHETGFKSALTKVMNEYTAENIKKDKPNFDGDDFREGLTAILSLKMKDVQFEGQTKTKLGNPEARLAVENVVTDGLRIYMQDLNNAALCQRIADKAVAAAKVREAAKKAKQMARQRISAGAVPLVGKLSACTGRDTSKNELFLVEGDSAGGSAKGGRDRRFQAILPLRGKPLNVEKKKVEHVLANEEFRSLITALGVGFGESIDMKNLKYDKIIILSDADQDGAHIRAILLTFFFRYYPQLIRDGHIYVAAPPLFAASKGKRILYAHNEKQLAAAKKELGRGAEVRRFKGLGEMDKEELWATTMDPEHRVLIQVEASDKLAADSIIQTLMGDAVEPRRNYIFQFADFNKKDNFKPASSKL